MGLRIKKAVEACGGTNFQHVKVLIQQVVTHLRQRFIFGPERAKNPNIEDIPDTVEQVLIESSDLNTTKAYILYREKQRTQNYWTNHFNTIGLVGMHKAIVNFARHGGLDEDTSLESGIVSVAGQAFAREVMHFLREFRSPGTRRPLPVPRYCYRRWRHTLLHQFHPITGGVHLGYL